MGGPRRDRLNLSSRFYIEFIINANTISVISYIYMHLSRGRAFVYRVTFNYLQFLSCGKETWSKNYVSRSPSRRRPLKIISAATVSPGVLLLFLYTFTSLVTSIDTLLHPRTMTIEYDENWKAAPSPCMFVTLTPSFVNAMWDPRVCVHV